MAQRSKRVILILGVLWGLIAVSRAYLRSEARRGAASAELADGATLARTLAPTLAPLGQPS